MDLMKKAEIIKAFRLNAFETKQRREKHPMATILKEHGELGCHYPIMSRFDFWEIFPVEGKYAMAVQYESKRRLAVLLSRWRLRTLK